MSIHSVYTKIGRLEWDTAKNLSNFLKHGYEFEICTEVDALFQSGEQVEMKEKPISKEKLKKIPKLPRTYVQGLGPRITKEHRAQAKRAREGPIDFSDNPETDEAFWADAEWIIPENKVALGVRFDREVVDWFKSQGPGYQTRMNAVLKLYMERHK